MLALGALPRAAQGATDTNWFRILSLTTNNTVTVDHDSLTSDDRGGIALSPTQVFVTGDSSTARFAAADLTGGASVGYLHDGLVSDLKTEVVYSLANGTNLIGASGGTVTSLVQLDGATGAATTNGITLSASISMSSSSGVFAGYGRIVLHNGSRVYNIDLPSGSVTDLGAMAMPAHRGSESWAFWGIAEFFGTNTYLVYVNSTNILRTRVPSGVTSTLASFVNLSDMATITFSPARNRWYFHHEGGSQFAPSGSEILGFCDATWDQSDDNSAPVISSIGNQNVAQGGTNGPLAFTISDAETPAASLSLVAVSSNPTLVPVANITFGGSGTNRTVTIRPAAGLSGTAIITLTVQDTLGVTNSTSFQLTVTGPPAISAVANILTNEPVTSVTVPFTVTDSETPAVDLIVTASASNPSLVSGLNVSGTDTNRSLTITIAPGQVASSLITITATDAALASSTRTFILTVRPATPPAIPWFRVTSLTTNNAVVVDVNATAGDDRGGIAVSSNSAFLSGDSSTARFAASNLTSGASLGIIYDGLVGNLRTEQVYCLANGTNLLAQPGGTVNALIELDGTTGLLTTNRIQLSTNITLNSGSGIFAGYDRILLHNGSRLYSVELPSGFVTDLGAMTMPTHIAGEGWAFWGVAEYFGNTNYLVYVRDGTSIARVRVPSGTVSVVAAFQSLSDMASITFSPSRNRWYFHHENSSQFGSFAEALGFADGTWDQSDSNSPPIISAIASQTMNEDAAPLAVPFNAQDAETPADFLAYAALSGNTTLVPLANITFSGTGTNRTVTVRPATNQNGTVQITVIVSDALGGSATNSFQLTINPTDDPPSINAISAQLTTRSTPVTVSFTVTDPETLVGLTLSAASSNTVVVPATNFVFAGTNTSRTVTITPAPGQVGVTIITLVATDATGLSGTNSFVLSVVPPSGVSYFDTVANTDFASFGYGGMRGLGYGQITVTNLTGTVRRALLYWHGPCYSSDPTANATVTFAGTNVTGAGIGFSDDNCWSFNNSQAYRADVTALVSTNGVYSLTNFFKSAVADMNGVSLLVFYDDGNPTNNLDVLIYDGNDSNISSPYDPANWGAPLFGIPYVSGAASLTLHVGDGQTFSDDTFLLNNSNLVAVFNGDTVPLGTGVNSGGLWDIKSFDLTPYLTNGVNNVLLSSIYNNDCLSLVVATVNLPAAAVNFPRLKIRLLSAGAAEVSWPADAAGFALQNTDVLAPPGWTNATNIPFLTGTQNVVTSTVASPQFFRLRKP
ncbi:MAG: hypothetical protein HZA89_08235 [Verrucomicrobia bacterium]|nr:hypothetical protein [Verrucomicrobiota bacterium]